MTFAAKKLPWYIWAPVVAVVGVSVFDFSAVWPETAPREVATFAGPTMGTRYAVTLAPISGPWPPDVAQLQQRVDARLAEINRLMSTYEAKSELSRFNQFQNDDWFSVAPETAEVVAAALKIAKRSARAFDPTIGPVVNLWGFGPQKGRTEPPGDQDIENALSIVGYQNVAVRLNPPALKKSKPEIYLDLSGIAKGHAADAVSSLLADLGFADSLVVIGGEVRARGCNAAGNSWRVGIEEPDDATIGIRAKVNLADTAISTSGDFHNYFEHHGVRYSHTIDPTTGRPVRHGTVSVSIVAPTGREADALATAVLVMGYPRGYEWCVERHIPATFFIREGRGVLEHSTFEFEKLLSRTASPDDGPLHAGPSRVPDK